MNTDDLETRRDAIADKLAAKRLPPELDELVRKADQAVAAFKSETTELENHIGEIDAQIGLRERDRRAAAEQERQQRLAAQRQQLIEEAETWVQAVADAESATRALVDAVNRVLAGNARIGKLAQELTPDGKLPMVVSPFEMVSRLAQRIASVMMTVVGHRNRLGPVQWPAGAAGLYPPDRSWREDEERRIAVQLLQPLLEKGKS